MATQVSRDDGRIDSLDVIARIDELEDEQLPWTVRRNRNNEDIQRFKTRDEALEFRTENDYDPDKVTIAEDTDENLDEELYALRQFAAGGEASIDGWLDGVILVRESDIDESYAQEHYDLNGTTSSLDLDCPPFDRIDWDAVAEDLQENASYATLNGTNYYAI